MPLNHDSGKYGRWPRRLLHVSSLTSYEWEPGNRYGGCVCPRYNTLSYTWGRFALKESERPEVQALPIKFHGRRSWKIPRIDPEHFSVAEFWSAVQLAVRAYETEERNVEFLWLDVACIDQEHPKTKHAEINRQAVIFKNAHASCVWMNHMTEDILYGIVSQLERIDVPHPYPKEIYTNPEQLKKPMGRWLAVWVPKLLRIVEIMLPQSPKNTERSDLSGVTSSAPWFSSLWTLQEAYLRPNACILPRDCTSLIRTYGSGQKHLLRLRTLARTLSYASTRLEEGLALGVGPHKDIHRLLHTIRDSGIREVGRNSRFSIFAASFRRQTSNPCDRVYGVMQVFGFQLPLQRRNGMAYSLSELQDMMSEKILTQFPVESQLFVHTELQAPGTKWKLGSSISWPTWATNFTTHSSATRGATRKPHPATPLTLCKLSVTHGSAYFHGRICALKDLLVPWRDIDMAKLFDELPNYTSSAGNVAIAFDMVPNAERGASRLQIPNVPGFIFADVNCNPEDTHKILATLARSDARGDLTVLLLGSCLDPLSVSYHTRDDIGYRDFSRAWREDNDDWYIGLIMRRKRVPRSAAEGKIRVPTDLFVNHYERIGVCKWFRWDRWADNRDAEISIGQNLTDAMIDVLSGNGRKWKIEEGYWG